MPTKFFSAAVAGILCSSLAGAVLAQQSYDDVIAKRRAAMTTIGSASGGIRAVAGSAAITPDQVPAVKEAAGKLVASFDALKDPAMWPKGSGLPEVASGTKAKAEIWSDQAGFAAALNAAASAAAAVKTAVDSGDLAQMKTTQAALQTTCGACHTKYRT